MATAANIMQQLATGSNRRELPPKTPLEQREEFMDDLIRGKTEASLRAAGAYTATHYVSLQPVGQGGMGLVTRAYDPKLAREVALKRVRRDSAFGSGEGRLEIEARALARPSPLRRSRIVLRARWGPPRCGRAVFLIDVSQRGDRVHPSHGRRYEGAP